MDSPFKTPLKMSSKFWKTLMAQFKELKTKNPCHGPITKLPTELLLDIFRYLGRVDLSSTTQVCRRWNDIALPILYRSVRYGWFGQDPVRQEAMLRGIAGVTLQNEKLCTLIRYVDVRITAYVLSEEEISNHFYTSLESLAVFSLDQECDPNTYVRMMGCVTFPTLRKLHIGLRCDAAEAGFPKLFIDSPISSGLSCLEEFRYDRLRTKSEAARIGEYHSSEDLIVDDHLGGGLYDSASSYALAQAQLFAEHYVHYLSNISSLKYLNLDLGVCPTSFIDLRRSNLPKQFAIISDFLGPTDCRLSPSRTRDKLLRLSHLQFSELVTDVSDEIVRRTAESGDFVENLGGTLPPIPHFHPKRNQARAKLSVLKLQRLRDLASDTHFQLLKSYPRLSRPASPYLFESESENLAFDYETPGPALIANVRKLQAVDKPSRDWSTMKLLRDMQKVVVPQIYQCVEEAGLRNVQKVRVRLVLDGPWIEVFIQRAEGKAEVEVYSLFPDVVLDEVESLGLGGGRWGVYALYEENRRVSVKVALLKVVEGKWGIQTRPIKHDISSIYLKVWDS